MNKQKTKLNATKTVESTGKRRERNSRQDSSCASFHAGRFHGNIWTFLFSLSHCLIVYGLYLMLGYWTICNPVRFKVKCALCLGQIRYHFMWYICLVFHVYHILNQKLNDFRENYKSHCFFGGCGGGVDEIVHVHMPDTCTQTKIIGSNRISP